MIEFREEKQKSKKIYISIALVVIVIILAVVGSKLLQYSEEGEQNLPFKIEKMTIISSADGKGIEGTENRWDFEIIQNNDVYFEINEIKNETRTDSFKKITLQNFNIIENPQIGEIKFYHPVKDKDLIYVYKDENLANEKIEYTVSGNNNVKKQEITKEEAIVSFSSCNSNLGTYTSNEDTEIKYDGTLLEKIGKAEEELKYKISFDMIIEMESNKKYKASFNLDLPLEKLISEGTIKKEITELNNVVFKRV